ncbi:MAG: phosphatase PAP2 family protein [Verrucomicrobiales bacterium]
MKIGLVWFTLVLGLFADEGALKHLSGAKRSSPVNDLSFENTQRWAPEFRAWTKRKPRFLAVGWRQRLVVAAPAENASLRSYEELDYLSRLVSERDDRQKQIQEEILVDQFRLGNWRYGDLLASRKHPETAKLLKWAYFDMAVVTFVFKERFDRVRPSHLSAALGRPLRSSIEVPNHPSYPSGHAVGAYTLAYLLSELDPANRECYWESAAEIGRNREVAGVHYPSDTEAGRQLARQLVDVLLENPDFSRQFQKAKQEWHRE